MLVITDDYDMVYPLTVDQSLQIISATSDDPMRENLQNAFLFHDKIVATSGHILVEITLADSSYQEQLYDLLRKGPVVLPREVLKHVSKTPTKRQPLFAIWYDQGKLHIQNSRGKVLDFDVIRPEGISRSVVRNIGRILDDLHYALEKRAPKSVQEMRFDVRLLKKLAEAIGKQGVLVEPYETKETGLIYHVKAIDFFTESGSCVDEVDGWLMPILPVDFETEEES